MNMRENEADMETETKGDLWGTRDGHRHGREVGALKAVSIHCTHVI